MIRQPFGSRAIACFMIKVREKMAAINNLPLPWHQLVQRIKSRSSAKQSLAGARQLGKVLLFYVGDVVI